MENDIIKFSKKIFKKAMDAARNKGNMKPAKIEAIKEHTKRVEKYCEIFYKAAEKNGIKIDEDKLLSAAWLHDIAKFNGQTDDDHNNPNEIKETLKWVNGDYSKFGDVFKEVLYIIKYHKGNDYLPPTKYQMECFALRWLDKFDRIPKKLNKYDNKKYNFDLLDKKRQSKIKDLSKEYIKKSVEALTFIISSPID